jgi:hypothetical protein
VHIIIDVIHIINDLVIVRQGNGPLEPGIPSKIEAEVDPAFLDDLLIIFGDNGIIWVNRKMAMAKNLC